MNGFMAPALFFFTAWALGGASGEEAGSIEGTATYEDGKPVHGATVYAHPLDRGMGAMVPHADSDENGHFIIRIDRSWFGRFAVAGKKEDEDYPDMTMQFYSDGTFQVVKLTSRHPRATVAIRLGPKAGVLVGTVADADTGVPLNTCVDFRRASNPNNFLTGTGLVNARYRVLVPSNTDVLMSIWLAEYKPWYYPGTSDKSHSTPVHLKPGEEQALDIRLEAGKSADDPVCRARAGVLVGQ
jgi:hypothetical protein